MTTQIRFPRAALACVSLLAPFAASATNGYQLMGIGGYQKSLGGAVTAKPGSAMTAITNPAGMARIGGRADFSMEAFLPDRFVDFRATGGSRRDSSADLYGVPSLGWSAPVEEGDDEFYFGGGIYGTSGLGVDYAPTADGSGGNWEGYSSIEFWQMAPTLAWNVSDRLALGASLNLDYQKASFRQRNRTIGFNFDLSRAASSFGVGLTLGALYDLSERVTVGASYKSKQHFSELEYQLAAGDIDFTAMGMGPLPAGTYKMELDYPQQLALGVAWQVSDRLALSADLKWIDWSDTMTTIPVSGPGGVAPNLTPGWDDQTVYALGIEYKLNDRVTLRAGYNYAESPLNGADTSSNLILPATVESHYAIGGEVALNKQWSLGFHYMYAPQETLSAPATDPMYPGARIGLEESSVGLNLGYRFR